jgi:general stress protein 26
MGKQNDQISLGEIFSYITENQYIYFATTQDKQPKIRPMVLFYYRGRFFFVTFTGDAKVGQIKSNKQCEVILPIEDDVGNKGYIKMTGNARINTDANDKDEAQYFCYFFDNMYDGSDDPDFTLIELDFETYELFRPGQNHSVKVNG